MCGISGLILNQANPPAFESLRRATDVIRHRGPDDEGFVWLPAGGSPHPFGGQDTMPELALPSFPQESSIKGAGFLLGHRRLSILDVSVAGHQPMAAADGKVWIAFNGEVYNFKELRAELADGFQFRTGSDTEVILAAWLKWGRDMLPRFAGMFALALADMRDPSKPLLLLARDPFGIKPLYYAETEHGFAFASEIKSMLSLGVKPQANAARLYTFFTQGCTDYGTGSLFAGVKQLPGGHWMEIRLAGERREVREDRYWNPDWRHSRDIGRADAVQELRRLFLENIRLHLRSDVPLGAALSGGIDSSSIVCGIREVEPGAGIRTFSYLSEDEARSEEKWMDVVAERAGAVPHKTRPSSGDLMHSIDKLMDAQDEPFGTTGIFAQYCVFKLARENGIKVMLDGQGADEILGGYHGYASLRLATMIRRGRWIGAFRFLNHARLAVGGGGWPLLRSSVRQMLPAELAWKVKKKTKRAGPAAVLRDEWFAARGITGPDLPPHGKGADRLRQGLWYSTLVNSLPMLLRFEDRNSMAHSVESRVPFLTPSLVEFILSLPEKYIIGDDGTSKSIFREAMRGLTPDVVLDRRDKLGFDTPEKSWLLSPEAKQWATGLINSDAAASLELLNMDLIRRGWEDASAGRAPCPPWLWRVLNLILWVQGRGVRC
ncbi:MAG TPA: asparagine synthase (glutamine-hydrolyzing) [Verrucomicrobiales bacterium]|nr:asparagine synthase (glutamine-hydrolyzing) [Verrucomicrobiales bacterium]